MHDQYHRWSLAGSPFIKRNHATYPVDLWRQLIRVKIDTTSARTDLFGILQRKRTYPYGRVVKAIQNAIAGRIGLKTADSLVTPGGPLFDINDIDAVQTPREGFFFFFAQWYSPG